MSNADETPEEPAVESDAADVEDGDSDTGAEEAPEVKPKRKSRKKSTTVDEPVDKWAKGGPIPTGAKGPTIAKMRHRLKIEDGGDKYDKLMKARVERLQRGLGLPVTGRIDVRTRHFLE